MDAALVAEGMVAHHGLQTINLDPGVVGDHLREGGEVGEVVAPDPSLHVEPDEHLLERSVPCPLPDPVHRRVKLECPCLGGGKGVGCRHPHVVVAVCADRPVHGLHDLLHGPKHLQGGKRTDGICKGEEVGPVLFALPVYLQEERKIRP
ncbi:MAG: hypothetical protein A4E39_01507 [Methanoregulaceae archaeon PtaB.Bin152]|nr:MAG: hypothetical protein A4E39_01507 [Methanoregulaceae archaeon PtaB.Bin152]